LVFGNILRNPVDSGMLLHDIMEKYFNKIIIKKKESKDFKISKNLPKNLHNNLQLMGLLVT
jgi:hypothetical protein